MLRIEDHLLPVIAAAMAGDLAYTIEDAHLGIGCRQRQRAAHRLGRNRVVVAVEAHIDGLGRAHRHHVIVETGAPAAATGADALRQGLRDGAIAIVRPGPLVRHLVAPLQRLAIALLQSRERARRQNESRTKRIARSTRPF